MDIGQAAGHYSNADKTDNSWEMFPAATAAFAGGDEEATQEGDEASWAGKGKPGKGGGKGNLSQDSRHNTQEPHSATSSTCSCSSWAPRAPKEDEKEHTKEERPTLSRQGVATGAVNLDTSQKIAGSTSSSGNVASVGR